MRNPRNVLLILGHIDTESRINNKIKTELFEFEIKLSQSQFPFYLRVVGKKRDLRTHGACSVADHRLKSEYRSDDYSTLVSYLHRRIHIGYN